MAIEIKTKDGLILTFDENFQKDYIEEIFGLLKTNKTWRELEQEVLEE